MKDQRAKHVPVAALVLAGMSLHFPAQAQVACAPMPDGKPRDAVSGADVTDRKTGLVRKPAS